jgi:peptidoglycan hydrolase-like protein with peptidoglycan-binding domain
MNYYIQCRSLPAEKLIVDGIYGVRTEAAVRAFQKQRGVSVDGIVSPTIWQVLQRDLANGVQQASC